MMVNCINFFSVLLPTIISGMICDVPLSLQFNDAFKFGIASAAYQIEGAWNESGKGVSIWDYYTHNTSLTIDGSNGDVACDSYRRYREDIALLKQIGVDHYRLSFSWARILPTGRINNINQAAVKYYDNLINELIHAGIEPWVTIYHWDLPKTLDNLGGFYQSKIVDYLSEYADLLFSLYGDRVKTWLTINEPHSMCKILMQYLEALDNTIPSGIVEYMCGHNILKAHARIYRLYQKKYKKYQNGRLSMALSLQSYMPASDSPADQEATERAFQWNFGWFFHPLVFGNYSKIMIDTIREYSAVQGFPESRLPKFTSEEIWEIAGSYDFIGLNNYVSLLVENSNSSIYKTPAFENDYGGRIFNDPSWATDEESKIKVFARGFGNILRRVKDTYNNPEIVITEQGYSYDGGLNDTIRIRYFEYNLKELLKCINEDGVNVTAYTIWSLLDDFEWISGYTAKLGLYYVDFDSPNRTRIPKASSEFYTEFLHQRHQRRTTDEK